jgi:class 3 adenylate cyclase
MDIRFAGAGDSRVSYRVHSDGPLDLVFLVGGPVAGEEITELAASQRALHRLASYSRLITLDFRGIGLSDPIDDSVPAMEAMAADILSVLDDVGSTSAAILALDFAAPAAISLAVDHAERVSALILIHAAVRTLAAPDFPWATDPAEWEAFRQVAADGQFSMSDMFRRIAPSALDNADARGALDRGHRRAGSPTNVRRFLARIATLDARELLPRVRVPTLVLNRCDNPLVRIEQGRFLAAAIPGSCFRELKGADHLPFFGEDADTFLEEVQEFLVGTRVADSDRVVATLLFTDIVGSTALASALGDRRWQDVLDAHDRISASEIRRYSGRLIKRTGDGILATFDGPGPAIRCARAISEAARSHDFAIRAGIHISEIERRGDDIGGLGVHLAARILALAEANEILVSPAVPLVMAGSDVSFADWGTHRLKGIDEEWKVYCVAS